jgi:calmodulin
MMLINSMGFDVPGDVLRALPSPISLHDLLDIFINQAVPSDHPAEVARAFSTFDVNNDGYITAAELHVGLNELGDAVTLDEAREMVKEADINGDGRLDYIEYKEKMSSKNN